jgi:hypothetical protein
MAEILKTREFSYQVHKYHICSCTATKTQMDRSTTKNYPELRVIKESDWIVR